jgi:hypothetical protein
MYWINFFKEIKIWILVRRVARKSENILEENNLRVDWVGRMYTVINLPDEIIENPYLEETYVISQLREYDKILISLGLADIVYPEFSKIEGEAAYLLILYPESDYLNWSRFIFNFIISSSIVVGIYFLWILYLSKHI